MTNRALLVLNSRAVRQKAIDWIMRVPAGTRVEFKEPQRTLDQNSRLWAMLTDIARQKTLEGRKWTTDQWKVIFLRALGHEHEFIPALNGAGFIPYGQSSSDLGVREMSDLIEFMLAWGAEQTPPVEWSEPRAKKEDAA
ncbi:recombination protein NinB [Rhodopseudomonas sp. G2_2311]|uniref:recombination protein NinB n=1 Tax=Rhodopseudomonas sp. G2_2311 TaxID=3114287 RepID=UPI0039C688EC